MKIYIVRHGETKSNGEGRFQGWLNDSLNENGVKLAEITGRAMSDLTFDAAFSSSLIRARHTAEIILKESGNSEVTIQIDDRIKEINMGDWDGKRFRPEAGEVDEEKSKQFFINPLKVDGFPNGESIKNLIMRTQEFLKELAEKDYDTVLVSTHGCAVRAMLNFLYDDPKDYWHGHVPYNCAVNVVEVKNGQLKLIEDDMILYDKKYCVDHYMRF